MFTLFWCRRRAQLVIMFSSGMNATLIREVLTSGRHLNLPRLQRCLWRCQRILLLPCPYRFQLIPFLLWRWSSRRHIVTGTLLLMSPYRFCGPLPLYQSHREFWRINSIYQIKKNKSIGNTAVISSQTIQPVCRWHEVKVSMYMKVNLSSLYNALPGTGHPFIRHDHTSLYKFRT